MCNLHSLRNSFVFFCLFFSRYSDTLINYEFRTGLIYVLFRDFKLSGADIVSLQIDLKTKQNKTKQQPRMNFCFFL